jgi:hypothetical protein
MRYSLLVSMQYHRGILTDKIPARGIPGALLVAVMMIAVLGMPAARQFFLITGAVGVLWAGLLYWWHNQSAGSFRNREQIEGFGTTRHSVTGPF